MATRNQLSQFQIEHQLILDSAGEGIYGLDGDGRITFSNAAATEILGWKHEDVVSRLYVQVIRLAISPLPESRLLLRLLVVRSAWDGRPDSVELNNHKGKSSSAFNLKNQRLSGRLSAESHFQIGNRAQCLSVQSKEDVARCE